MYAKIINEVVEKYPYNYQEDHPLVSIIGNIDSPEHNTYFVHLTEPNNPDPENLNTIESTPIFDGTKWIQAWEYTEKTEEEKRQARYNPSALLNSMFSNGDFASWIENFSSFQQSGIAAIATNAKIDNDWTVMQSAYNQLKTIHSPVGGAVADWQAIADQCGIPLEF